MTYAVSIREYDLDIEEQMAQRISSSVFIVRAVPMGGGKFNALYSAPGLVPAIAESADGRVYEYNSEKEAEAGAAKALIGILNAPRVRARQSEGKPERYQKLTGPEFAVLLQRAELTLTFFAELYGTSQQRVLQWIDSAEDVPHPVRIILELFVADPKNIDRAQAVTNAVTTSRRTERQEVK